MREPALRRMPLVAAALAVVVLSSCGGGQLDGPPPSTGTVVDDPPVALPAAPLVNTAGNAVDLRTVSAAPLTLTVFAYTTCLDECPLTVSSVAAALRGLSRTERDAVQLLVLSADPARDTPAALRRWLDRFDTGFVGLTGDPEVLTRAARELFVPLELPSAVATSDGNDVAHGVQIWAFGRDDRSRMVWSGSPTPSALRSDLVRLIADEQRR